MKDERETKDNYTEIPFILICENGISQSLGSSLL